MSLRLLGYRRSGLEDRGDRSILTVSFLVVRVFFLCCSTIGSFQKNSSLANEFCYEQQRKQLIMHTASARRD